VTIIIYLLPSYEATGFKHINKSIMGATVSMYRSECLVVSGEEEAKGKFWSSWFKLSWTWHWFSW